MVIYDARPSAFTQLTSTAEWEALASATGDVSIIDFTVGNALSPSFDVPGRNIVIADGNIAIKGMLWRCDAPVSTPIPAASAQNRIDRLVMRLTRGATTSATVIAPTVITGTPSGSPVEPSLVQTPTGIWDYPICSWTATSAGALSGLTDERQYSIGGPNGPIAFTPSMTGGGALAFSTAIGYYYVTGDLVFCNVFFVVSTAGTGSSNLTMTGPPINIYRGVARQFLQGSGEGATNVNGPIQAVAFTGGTANIWDRVRRADGNNAIGTDFLSGALLIFQGTYRKA